MKNGARNSGKPVKVHVAAFGKHPGWDDHIEEIGLDCPQLVKAKRVMYTECIGGNIDSGEWEKLDEAKRLPFKHEFVWCLPDGVILGRLWASRDGKGRTKYPMVVCAFVENAPLDWACVQVLPRLAQMETDCTQTSSAELVRFAVGGCQSELTKAAEAYGQSPPPEESVGDLVSRLVNAPELSANGREGMVRVLYEMSRELPEFTRSGQSSITSKNYEPPCAHLRVPRALLGTGEGARAWVRVMEQEILPGSPVLVLSPAGQRFVDVLVGEPKVKAFFCARAGDGAVGLASDVPYTMEPSEIAGHKERLESWARGGASGGRSAAAAAGSGLSREARIKIGLLALAGVLLIAIVIALAGGKKPAPTSPESSEAASNHSQAPSTDALPKNNPETAPVTSATPEPAPTGDGDPRAAWTISDGLSRSKAALDRLDADLKAEGMSAAQEPRQNLADVERRVGLVRAMPWRAASRDQIARDVQTLNEQLAAIDRDIKTGLDASTGRTAAVIQERARAVPVKSRVLVAAWGAGVAAIDPSKGRETALARVDAIASALKSAEQQLDEVAALQAPTGKLIDAAKWSNAAETRRDRAAREASEAAVAGDNANVGTAVNALTTWNQDATAIAGKAQQLEDLLAAGKVLSTEAKPTARDLEAAMQASPAYADLGLAVRPLLDQVEAVRSVASLTSPEALLSAVKGAGTDPARVPGAVAAWSRLGELGWPSIPADLVEASRLASSDLLRSINAVPDAGQRSALLAQASDAGKGMWTRFVSASAINQAGAEAALAAMGGLGVAEPELAKLPDWARYNLLLAQFRSAVAAKADSTAIDQPTREAIARFVAGVEALGATTQQHSEIDTLLKSLRPLRDPGAGLEFSKLGPGVLGWAASLPDSDGGVTYTFNKPGVSHTLHFRRVATNGDTAAYMSTTEVSVGQFIDVVRAAGKWDDIKPLLATYPPTGDTRRGVRVWEWSSTAGEVMRVIKAGKDDFSRGWLRPKPSMSGKDFYAAGLTVGAPTPDMPMQYVSPTAAVVFARVMGCRLPSSEEWKSAAASNEGTANLRDAAWLKQYEQTKALTAQDDVKRDPPDFPGAGIFWPAGTTKPQPQADATAATDTDDGVLWFAPVGSGSQFQHLVGNVSEYVWEDPASMDTLEASPVKVRPFLGTGDKLRVIGGSALSPREVPVREAVAVNLAQAREGYSDVGFRLAFSAPKGAGSANGQPLSALLKGAPYLAPDKR